MLRISENPSTPGTILLPCQQCGNLYSMPDFRNEIYADALLALLEKDNYCESCAEKLNAQLTQMLKQTSTTQEELLYKLKVYNFPYKYTHDRETGALLTAPVVRFAAEWIWVNKERNLLLSGITGSGKSTSACFVGMMLLKQGLKVRYATLSNLLADWRDARKSDTAHADQALLHSLLHDQQILIIDEVMGKCTVSQSSQEFLFELLERINAAESGSRIWLLGNFYSGSIEETFADPDPVRRRLQENFLCGRIADAKIVLLNPWEESHAQRS